MRGALVMARSAAGQEYADTLLMESIPVSIETSRKLQESMDGKACDLIYIAM